MSWSVKPFPKICRRTGLQVGWRFTFRSYVPEKRRNQPVSVESIPEKFRECQCADIPDLLNGTKCKCLKDAEEYSNSKAAEADAVKIRILKRKEWEEKFQNFKPLLEAFAKEHQLAAPNSWKNDVYYLETYVFPFFLGSQLSNNVQNWALYYSQFKSHLREVKPLKYDKKNLSINTQNKIIKSLNLFLSFLTVAHPVMGKFEKCSVYPKSMCARASAEHVLEDHEIPIIHRALMDIRPISADLFVILVRTGIRINEPLGLCIAFISAGEIEGLKSRRYHELIAKYGLKYFGYICLESQPALDQIRARVPSKDRFGISWSAGSVPRKPLKHRPEISPKHFRYIPIVDKEAWDVVVRLYNNQIEKLENGEFGSEERDYLLFDGMTASKFYIDLMKAFEATGLKPRSPHKVGRHTYATWFYGVTCEDPVLAEKVLGHRDKATMDNYSHLAEQIGREQQQKIRGRKKLV